MVKHVFNNFVNTVQESKGCKTAFSLLSESRISTDYKPRVPSAVGTGLHFGCFPSIRSG